MTPGLILLVIVIGVLTPLAQLGTAISLMRAEPVLAPRFDSNWPVYLALALGVIAARAILCLLVARELLQRKDPSTPRRAVIGVWIAYGFLGLLGILFAGLLNPSPFRFDIAFRMTLWPFAICAISTAYLLGSRRVAEVYAAR